MPSRRQVLRTLTAGAASLAAPALVAQSDPTITIDPTPLFELSPYLYMQFMEPLGAIDGSVEAAWDHLRDDWRDDVVAITRDLGPTMMRWGGIFTDFYRWREGVGPRATACQLVIESAVAGADSRATSRQAARKCSALWPHLRKVMTTRSDHSPSHESS